MRLKLTIAYDGAPFSGWARQPQKETIQGVIESALQEVSKQEVKLHGSGRTDSGVHADGQVAHFDVSDENSMNPYNWVPALNTKLPPSIRILGCEEVSPDFHARFSARAKTYLYTIDLNPVLHPHRHQRVWHLPRQLDPETLEECLQSYVGSHDFQNFSALRGNETDQTSYVRTLTQSSLSRDGLLYQLTFSANGFLYKMVRILTGVAVQVAQARLLMSDFESMLMRPLERNHAAKYCAPPSGLSLKSVDY